MPTRSNKISRFWQELKRRNVLRSLAIYAGTAFIILEASGLKDHPEDMDASQAFLTGELYLYLGKEAKAFEWIESGLSRGYGWLDVRHSPLYNDLAQKKEFQEMITQSEEASK